MGCEYIKNAEFLFKEKGFMSGFELLFVHGVELLLKSFILLNDTRETRVILDDFKFNYKHDQLALLKYAKELDSQKMLSERISNLIEFHADNFYKDTIDARYTQAYRERSFDQDAFSVVNEDFINPILNAYSAWLLQSGI